MNKLDVCLHNSCMVARWTNSCTCLQSLWADGFIIPAFILIPTGAGFVHPQYETCSCLEHVAFCMPAWQLHGRGAGILFKVLRDITEDDSAKSWKGTMLGPPVVPFSPLFWGSRKSWYPYSNLSTGGPRMGSSIGCEIQP